MLFPFLCLYLLGRQTTATKNLEHHEDPEMYHGVKVLWIRARDVLFSAGKYP